MTQISELKGIKSILSGENSIKKTAKGIRYRFFHSKRRDKSKRIFGNGYVFFFSDYGDKACFNKFCYSLASGKPTAENNTNVWFNIKDGRMKISTGAGIMKRIISNNPSKLDFTSNKNTKLIGVQERFKKILLKWALKNGIKIKRKWYKYDINTVCLLLCYPELEYLLDFNKNINIKIPSIISSHLKGITGLNHALDRLCGFHGKKFKKELSKTQNFINVLANIRVLKGLVTNDDITTLLEKNIIIGGQHKEIRYFLKNYSRDTIMNWINNESLNIRTTNITWIKDAAFQYYRNHKDNPNNKIVLPETNNIEDIHNIITNNNRRFVVAQINTRNHEEEEKAFKNALEKYSSINNLNINDFKLFLPEKPQDLIEASSKLSNCLSGYIYGHGQTKLIILVNYKDELKYAISIADQNMEQFYGKFNALPNKDDYFLIRDKLIELKLIKCSSMDIRFVEIKNIDYHTPF